MPELLPSVSLPPKVRGTKGVISIIFITLLAPLKIRGAFLKIFLRRDSFRMLNADYRLLILGFGA
jgi:hypothetical protein